MGFVTSGPVVAMELVGVDCVKRWRQLIGKIFFIYMRPNKVETCHIALLLSTPGDEEL